MRIHAFLLGILLSITAPWLVCVQAQDTPPAGGGAAFESLDDFGGLGDFDGFGMEDAGEELTLSGSFTMVDGTRQGTLKITAKLAGGWHTYAMDQKGGPGPAEISVATDGMQLKGPFTPDQPPDPLHVRHQ